MMKKFLLIAAFTSMAFSLKAQYPATPTFEKVKTEIKAGKIMNYDRYLKEGIKVPEALRSKVEIVPVTKEIGFNATTGYYRSDDAFKAGQGKGYNDQMFYNFAIHVPKEIFGVEYYLPFRITYSRLDESFTPLNEWRMKHVEEVNEKTAIGAEMPDFNKRKELLVAYFKDHFKEMPGGHFTEKYFSKWLKVEDVIVNNNTATKAVNILVWQWEMIIKYEKRSNGDISIEYDRFNFNVNYDPKTKVFTPVSVSESKVSVGEDVAVDRKTYTPDKPMNVGNLFANGWDAVYKKYAPVIETAYSQAAFDRMIKKFDTLLKSVNVNQMPDVQSYFAETTALNDFKEAINYWKNDADNKDIAEWKVSEANYVPQTKNDMGQLVTPYSGEVAYDVNFKHIQTGKKKKAEADLPYLSPAGMRFYWEYKKGSFKIIKVEKT